MRTPRLILVLFCLVFFPICLTFFSALSSPRVAAPSALDSRTSGLHALFSFNIPSSLFPPSAIISLTDDNSTFFLARPAAFGPLLPSKGLSGPLWIGSGFSEGILTTGVEGELGCSDIPGWGEGISHRKRDKASRGAEQSSGKSGSSTANEPASPQSRSRSASQVDAVLQNDKDGATTPSLNDGTDDHLHHPLPESAVADTESTQKHGDYTQKKPSAHADIQSLQEAAEIRGKVVLLSRGGCGFLEKVKWAQRRGGVALIVGDDTRGGNLVTMYARGDTSNVTIPALFTSLTTAHLLSSLVPGHTGDTADLGDVLKSSQAKLASQSNFETQRVATKDSTSTLSSNRHSTTKRPTAFEKSGNLGRFEDSRRPPSSGKIDWMPLDSQDNKPSAQTLKGSVDSRRNPGDTSDGHSSGVSPDPVDGDGFVIGVHDWRDPDFISPKSSTTSTTGTTTTGKDDSKTSGSYRDANPKSNMLQGGSITPGSGEYQSIDKSSGKVHDASGKMSEKESSTSNGGSKSSSKGWFSSHFGWGHDTKQEAQPSSSPSPSNTATSHKTPDALHSSSRANAEATEHEGLWVTLTPTSMSTSPFFDTLLVLVVSPLLTLSVVYALLLLRSRIRRRRWRAPKSVVERLPVRTYHTISSTSSSSSNSTRPSSRGALSPTSPLLGSEPHPSASRSNRRRSQTIFGTMLDSSGPPKEEKSTSVQSGSTLWRRKYTSRQVECVVCLEEYVDGQSRVMSLPCGHEFHAECITPWLTTRRRTCPICKGDVVRSMAHYHADDSHTQDEQVIDRAHSPGSRAGASSAPVLITGVGDDEGDTEQQAGLLDDHATSAPQSTWRNLSSLSFSALSGDTIWHQARADRNR
ncbi:hypothetical protein NUU61_005001 [Penicillium alfredii]|uniref:RING-type E3 ubiquitin transferase n=1 Tax=Penicillium alfredii TaxID=1506179 RepID=A0A9W9F8K3_9EURO|nr:uncharacterized protein NUU61_005001 [Penicillium alfredii]KAJ5095645.1 hypothetical protein NUU61_005001 [Penicillium alfredii]